MIKAKFELERETKGTYRYKEISDIPVVGTLYIKKYAMNKPVSKISLEIKLEEE